MNKDSRKMFWQGIYISLELFFLIGECEQILTQKMLDVPIVNTSISPVLLRQFNDIYITDASC